MTLILSIIALAFIVAGCAVAGVLSVWALIEANRLRRLVREQDD